MLCGCVTRALDDKQNTGSCLASGLLLGSLLGAGAPFGAKGLLANIGGGLTHDHRFEARSVMSFATGVGAGLMAGPKSLRPAARSQGRAG